MYIVLFCNHKYIIIVIRGAFCTCNKIVFGRGGGLDLDSGLCFAHE